MDAEARVRRVGVKMSEEKLENPEMHIREIELEDGRYMIFYTFGDEQTEADENV